MKAMDSDLRRLVTSYVRRVTPKMSSWYRLSSYGDVDKRAGKGLARNSQSETWRNIYPDKTEAELKVLRYLWSLRLCVVSRALPFCAS